LFLAAVKAARSCSPRVGPSDSDRVLLWLLSWVLRAFVFCVWLPRYWLALCIALPWTAIVCLAGSLPLAFVIATMRLSFSSEPPRDERGWLHGTPSEGAGASFLWGVVCFSMWTAPLLVPLIPLTVGFGKEE
jgi:hypothetical protein